MSDFHEVPGFLLDRAISALEAVRQQIDSDLSTLRMEKTGRTWHERRRRQKQQITADLIRNGMTDENQARTWLTEQGHSWKYAGEILSAMRKRVDDSRKAAREVEIFRRWWYCKEKKAALAREFEVSRATVERICKKLSENESGLKEIFNLSRPKPEKPHSRPALPPEPPREERPEANRDPLHPNSKRFLYHKQP